MINWFEQYHSSVFISDLIKTQTHLFVADQVADLAIVI